MTESNIAITELQGRVGRLRREVGKLIVGLDSVVEEVIIALLCGGHVLLEGAPGLGKTQLVKGLSRGLELTFSRIQFTPDLMPADILGTNVLIADALAAGERRVVFQKGPIFANLVLADEINRSTPKTQSALLEAMQEQSVTIAGQTYRLDLPFFVMATQNPIEMEGTYPLPEAQIDRFFFKLRLNFPSPDELRSIIDKTTGESEPQLEQVITRQQLLDLQRLVREVPIASHVTDFAIAIVSASHPQRDESSTASPVEGYVRYGASPRGAQALVLAAKARALLQGRFNASIDDVMNVAHAALRHRIIMSFEAEADGVDSDWIIDKLLERNRPKVAS